MKFKCIVVDDEQLARKLLQEYIEKVPYLELEAQFKNPLEAISFLQDHPIDLLFLDIQMPDLTGIEMLKSITLKTSVILTTAYSEYAIEGYELNVIDYLLKPFSFERFLQGVNKVSELLKLKYQAEIGTQPAAYITIQAEHKIYKMILNEILYIEGLKEYVSYYTTKGQRIIALQSLKSLEETLPKNGFMRIHRSYIVPIDKIDTLEGNRVRIGEKLIPIGRSYKDLVMKRVFKG